MERDFRFRSIYNRERTTGTDKHKYLVRNTSLGLIVVTENNSDYRTGGEMMVSFFLQHKRKGTRRSSDGTRAQ
jgi:hypothetical protein